MAYDGSRTSADRSLAPLVGASTWEHELFDHLTDHMVQERALLEEYERAASETRSEALAFLIHLLVEDERRHHRLFKQLAMSLKSSVELRPGSPAVPRMDFYKENRAEVLEVTRRLLEREKDDARQLRRLSMELSEVNDTTLWGLLIDLMRRDTEKHIALLGFAHRHAKRSVS